MGANVPVNGNSSQNMTFPENPNESPDANDGERVTRTVVFHRVTYDTKLASGLPERSALSLLARRATTTASTAGRFAAGTARRATIE
jgi:hypothetical protein